MTDRPRHVVFATDDRGFKPLAVAVYSLLATADAGKPLRVSVLTGCGALTEAHRERLRTLAGDFPFAAVECVDVDAALASRLETFANDRIWGRMAWARCFVGELFPESHGNIVYLDIDTLVCRDLAELYELDLGRNVLAAVAEECRETGRMHDPIWTNGLLDARAGYYCNSGVLVMNVDAFRDERLLDRITAWYQANRTRVIRPDQDALNCLFWDRIVRLHPRYNHCDGWLERHLRENPRTAYWRGNERRKVLEAIDNPAILHFWGSKKPWQWNHRPEGARYADVMRKAGMLDGPLPGTTPLRSFVTVAFAAYHSILRRLVRHKLRD